MNTPTLFFLDFAVFFNIKMIHVSFQYYNIIKKKWIKCYLTKKFNKSKNIKF